MMNHNHIMTHISDVTEIFNNLPKDHSSSSIYINIENIIQLIELSSVLYNNNPLLRTHMISKIKTYNLNTQKYDLIDNILKNTNKIQDHNLFLIVNNSEMIQYIRNKSKKIAILSLLESTSILDNDANSILVLDTNINLLNVTNKKNAHLLIYDVL